MFPHGHKKKPTHNTSSSTSAAKSLVKIPRVVILGGGYGGALLARTLDRDVQSRAIEVILVDRRETFHHRIGAIRAQVLGREQVNRVLIPLRQVIQHGTVLVGDVVNIDASTRTLTFANSSIPSLQYDVLVCATGSGQAGPGDLPPHFQSEAQVHHFFEETRSKIEGAKSIVIVGGGPSAIEVAGEIRHAYSDKEITIVASATHLLSTMVSPLSPKFLALLYQKLKEHNIKTIMGEKVIEPGWQAFQSDKFLLGPVTIKTQGDKNIEMTADLVIWAAAYRNKSSFYPSSWLNDVGEVAVRDSFQQLDYDEVFAVGDIISIPETKMALAIPSKMPILRHNILRVCDALRKGQPAAAVATGMKTYTPKEHDSFVLPLGPTDGVTQTPSMFRRGTVVSGGTTASRLKGSDLYTEMWFRNLTGKQAPLASSLKKPSTHHDNGGDG